MFETNSVAAAWLDDVVAQHGVPHPDGWHINLTQRELAAKFGIAESTIQLRVANGKRMRRVVRTRPYLVVTDAPSAAPSDGVGPWCLQAVAAARAAITDGCDEAAGALLDVVLAYAAPSAATAPRTPADQLAEPAADDRGSPAEAELASESSKPLANSASERPRNRTRKPADVVVQRSPEEARAFVAELEELARRDKNLRGLTDVDGLRDALGAFTDDQVRRGVAHVAALTRSGGTTSPIGYLIRIAREHSPVFDLAPPEPGPPTETPRDPVVPSSPEHAKERLAAARGGLR